MRIYYLYCPHYCCRDGDFATFSNDQSNLYVELCLIQTYKVTTCHARKEYNILAVALNPRYCGGFEHRTQDRKVIIRGGRNMACV